MSDSNIDARKVFGENYTTKQGAIALIEGLNGRTINQKLEAVQQAYDAYTDQQIGRLELVTTKVQGLYKEGMSVTALAAGLFCSKPDTNLLMEILESDRVIKALWGLNRGKGAAWPNTERLAFARKVADVVNAFYTSPEMQVDQLSKKANEFHTFVTDLIAENEWLRSELAKLQDVQELVKKLRG